MNGDSEKIFNLEGKVAKILNERELVINLGSKNNVKKQMKFKVLSPNSDEIIDPDSKEKIGTIDRIKVKVEVIEVKDKFSICKTYQYKTASSGLNPLFNSLQKTPELLKTTETNLPAPLSEDEIYVKIGDRVVQFEENLE
jgi:hypothetical protein